MNRIHIISGTVIATISLLLVTASMSDQQSAFAHEGYYYYGNRDNNNHHHGGSATATARLAIARLKQPSQVVVQQPQPAAWQ